MMTEIEDRKSCRPALPPMANDAVDIEKAVAEPTDKPSTSLAADDGRY
jgi:hypothetical protein